MFTGIIEEVGCIQYIRSSSRGGRISVSASIILQDIHLGDSIAVNGVCLTAVEFDNSRIVFDASPETLQRTTLGKLRVGDEVNLERALRADSRLGGHIVQGHVDATGKYLGYRQIGNSYDVTFSFPRSIARYICEKGSIAVDGVSLTVASLAQEQFTVAVVPHTWQMTALKRLRIGDLVNLEADVVAKYLERLLEFRRPDSGMTIEKLKEMGY